MQKYVKDTIYILIAIFIILFIFIGLPIYFIGFKVVPITIVIILFIIFITYLQKRLDVKK